MVRTINKVSRIKGFFHLIRPFTLLAPFVVSSSIMIASYVSMHQSVVLDQVLFSFILPASLSFVFLNGASNALNQATDFQADAISKPYRPLPKGIISKNEAIAIAIILYITAFLLGSIIHPLFLMFLSLITFFTITYSMKPRMKDRLWFNQLWIAFPRGFLAILASWCVFGSIINPIPFIIACIAGLFLFGGSIAKDISDKQADTLVGTQTLITCYGEQKAACIILPFLFFPFIIIPVFINTGLLPVTFWVLTFLAIPAFVTFLMMIKPRSNHFCFENTKAWFCMYITYFIFSISFSALTVAETIL